MDLAMWFGGLLAIFLLCASSIWELQLQIYTSTPIPSEVKISETKSGATSAFLDQSPKPSSSSFPASTPPWDSLLGGIWLIGFLSIIAKAIMEFLLLRVVLLSLCSISLNLRIIHEKPYSMAAYRQALQHLHSSDTQQKILGLQQLGQWGRRNSFSSIKPLVQDLHPEVRKKALWAVQQIGCLPAFCLISQQVQGEDQTIRQFARQLIATYPRSRLRAYLLDHLEQLSLIGQQ